MKRLREEELALWRSFVRLHASVIRRIEQDLADDRLIPFTWYDVLVALYQSPNRRLRMGELKERTVLTASGITRLVERLEQQGLVRRERTDEDRRSTYAVLTREGKRAFLKAWPTYERGIAAYFVSMLSDEERRVIRSAFERMLAAHDAKGTEAEPS
jgi:Transcriptional regulators